MPFEARKVLKAQSFTDFLAKMTYIPSDSAHTWTIFTNGSPNSQDNGGGLILKNGVSLMVKVSLPSELFSTNNQVEYEAVIVGINLAIENIKLKTDFQLVISQFKWESDAKDLLLQ